MLNALAVTVLAAEETHHEVDQAISWGVGALVLAILVGLVLALIAFGAGREHS